MVGKREMATVKHFDGCEVREIEVPDRPGRRRFRLEDVCPADSECMAARLEMYAEVRGQMTEDVRTEQTKRPAQLMLIPKGRSF